MNLRNLFFRHVAQTSPSPVGLQIKKSRGVYLTDVSGKRYIDLISGISVSNIGHRNPAVIKAVRDQCSKYMHTMVYGEHIQNPQVRLAQKLTDLLPASLNSVYFTNSGAEAVEGAMKLAKRATGRSDIIAMRNAYHGSTQGALSLMDNEYFTGAFRPLLPQIKFMRYNQLEDTECINHQTACVFVELIQSEAGYLPGDYEFLSRIRHKCHETGALLVVDEIQTGMGRAGTLFAFEPLQIVPDILLLAKGLGGGMPLGCFIADKSLMQKLTDQPVLGHLTTFGGHPVSCAAALATLDELLRHNWMQSVEKKSALFRKYLSHPSVKSITGKGLMLAVHLEDTDTVQRVIACCMEQGVLIDWFLFNEKALRIAPPLIITQGEIKKVCGIIVEALNRESAF